MESQSVMPKEVCDERQKRFDDAAGRIQKNVDMIQKDVDDQDDRTKKLEEINIKMGTILEQLTKDSADQAVRLRELEMKPAKRYDAIVQNVIQWIIIAWLAASKYFGK